MTKSIIESLKDMVDYYKEVSGKAPDKMFLGDQAYEELIEELKTVHVYEPRSVLNTKDIILWGVKIERMEDDE